MALLLLELKGPDFFRVGLFPGIIKDWQGDKKKSQHRKQNTFTKLKYQAHLCLQRLLMLPYYSGKMQVLLKSCYCILLEKSFT